MPAVSWGTPGLISAYQARDHFCEWVGPTHNPFEGKNRPAFSWPAFYRYCKGEVDADGQPVKRDADVRHRGQANPRNG